LKYKDIFSFRAQIQGQVRKALRNSPLQMRKAQPTCWLFSASLWSAGIRSLSSGYRENSDQGFSGLGERRMSLPEGVKQSRASHSSGPKPQITWMVRKTVRTSNRLSAKSVSLKSGSDICGAE